MQPETMQDDVVAAPGPGTGDVLLRLLTVLGLLYVFLLSIHMMGAAFKLFGKEFAEGLIRSCSSPVIGLFIGILTTSLVQSSSMTTSLTVGFVGGGMLPLNFAIPVIMGANIGTTITNILVSFGFVTRREDFRRAFAGATVHDFFNLCAVVIFFPLEIRFGLIQRLAESLTRVFDNAGGVKFTSPLKAIIKPVADVVLDFFSETLGMPPLWAGILVITLAAAALIASLIYLVKTMRVIIVQRAERFINRYLFRNDFTAFFLAVALTAMAQSSSVTTSLIVPLVGAGIVSLRRCYPYTLGANVGTTCTALLASLATVSAGEGGSLGVTAAFAHLLFNLLGIAVFYPLKAVPIFLAERLAAIAAESKRWAVVFVLGVFFGVPLVIIFVSRWMAGGAGT
jgi:sodium-dependent phosphate cotransporter